MPAQIITIPCLSDNYAYLIHIAETGETALVDAPEAAPIQAALEEKGWALNAILLTHHHNDHIAGVEALRAAYGARVIGGAKDAHRLPPLDEEVSEGSRLSVIGLEVEVADVSGHTVGHIAFYMPELGAAFTADSLMALGCGRLFEGDAPMMWASLSRLARLPEDTLIYSGHEYTEANARFALTVDPGNENLKARAAHIAKLRQAGTPTVPSTLAEEKATNPFLRAADPAIRTHLGMQNAADEAVFAEIRRRKDSF